MMSLASIVETVVDATADRGSETAWLRERVAELGLGRHERSAVEALHDRLSQGLTLLRDGAISGWY
ncbi:MAG: hypothetical protein ACRDFS_08560 [Chloroflexota bacterium]